MGKIKFVFGRVFPPDQLMSRWVATLALAFNDLALVHARLEEDQDTAHKFLYWLRLGIAHFHEAAAFIAASSEVKEVRDFVATLSADAQESYADCLKRFKTRETPVARLRNQAAFHYPRLDAGRANPPMKRVLESLSFEVGQIDTGTTGKVRDARNLFADDVASRLFVTAAGGDDALADVHHDISDAIRSFMRFANAAIDEWFIDAQRQGAKLFSGDEPVAT